MRRVIRTGSISDSSDEVKICIDKQDLLCRGGRVPKSLSLRRMLNERLT